MADQVDSMSDAELRTKLAEHGFPVMPITASTRKTLARKLKLVLDNKSKPRNSVDVKAETRRSLARYSSGEESDLDTSNVKEKRGRRATTGGAMLPPASNRARRPPSKIDTQPKRDSEKADSDDENKSPVRTHEEVETVTTRRVRRTYAADDDYETGSDSDVDGDKKAPPPLRSSSRSSDHISSTLPAADAYTPPKTSIFSRPSLGTNNYPSTLSSSDHLNDIRARLGLTSTLGDRPSVSSYSSRYSTSTYQPSASVDEVESPYLSNFTKRLSMKADSKSMFDRGTGTGDTTNGSTILPRRTYLSGASRSDIIDYKAANDKKLLKNNVVSLALVGIVMLFFFGLFFVYIVKKNDITSVVDDPKSVVPRCQLNIPGNRPGINCVSNDQVSYAKDLLKVIHPELLARAAAFKCGKPGAVPYLTEQEIINIARSRAETIDANQCRTDFNNLQVLLVLNPSWGISVVQLKNLYSKDGDYTTLNTIDEVLHQRSKGSIAIAISDPSTPLNCLIINTIYSAGSTALTVGFIILLAFALQRAYVYYVCYKKRKSEEIYSMVEQIIDIISQETEGSGEPYISVDHVRNTIISPQNREKMSSTWDAAMKFIQSNENRVRMEVQSVDGEDCKVWRWISSHNNSKRSTVWQGQAFETQEGSVNNLPVSPTPCLKIRSMFDKTDTNPNLRSVITDAILEKCDDRCNILHIDIDRTSGCVYVKCASQADAGVVYRCLHGWWYDGNLITVKYLRLERYMQRFPNSPSAGPYLMSSRQQHRGWDE